MDTRIRETLVMSAFNQVIIREQLFIQTEDHSIPRSNLRHYYYDTVVSKVCAVREIPMIML
ncbi:MAG: hypothetical protein H6Q68_3506 [Firmicutes bacterium]|nr:hypothetical protein [Bacillota bacterium]